MFFFLVGVRLVVGDGVFCCFGDRFGRVVGVVSFYDCYLGVFREFRKLGLDYLEFRVLVLGGGGI